ncbi:MAG: peptidoglycan-binding protein [Clostridia bacterium]
MKQCNPILNHRGAWSSLSKRAAMILLLALACIILSGCYMTPDNVTDPNNGLNAPDGGQGFDTVITAEPVITASPSPAPAPAATENQQVDWANWNFGDDTATNPPNNVIPVTESTPNPLPQKTNQGGQSTVGVNKATATPKPDGASNAGSTLKKGSKGTDVKRLQQQLKNLGYYTGSVDGTYGEGTATAVQSFQSVNGLTSDGKAGKATQEKLYSANAKKKPAGSNNNNNNNAGKPTKKPASSYTNGKTDIYLRIGSSGAQVKILQNRLIVLGYMSGTADGDFEETTEAAVIAFQKRNGIYSDGIAGPTTLTKLYSSSAKKAAGVAANLGSLKEGMSGGGVRSLQTNLKALNYYTGNVDGDYGAGTTAAVTAFQSSNGLTADGVAGKATMNAIYAAINGTGNNNNTSSGTKPEVYGANASSNGYATLSTTSKNNKQNVTALQSALSATGYYNGSLDGSFGNDTASAISEYQRAIGLRVTGMAGPSTQRLLYGGTPDSGNYSKLKIGSTGSAVKKLQYALYELKYYDGDITGKFDQLTEGAVRTFQQVNALDMDGVAGEQTQQRLFSSAALPCNI